MEIAAWPPARQLQAGAYPNLRKFPDQIERIKAQSLSGQDWWLAPARVKTLDLQII